MPPGDSGRSLIQGAVVIDTTKSDTARRIALLGAPIDIGASQRGTLMGPAALRTAGLLTVLDNETAETYLAEVKKLSVRSDGDRSIAEPGTAHTLWRRSKMLHWGVSTI